MTLARILAVLLLCPSLSFAQKSSDATSAPAGKAAASSAEAWQILAPVANAKKAAITRDDQFVIDPGDKAFKIIPTDPMALNLYAQLGDDSVCYAIRSYVVARDSKDSDSVHPVSSSTCVPSKRYRLKTVKIQAEPAQVSPQ